MNGLCNVTAIALLVMVATSMAGEPKPRGLSDRQKQAIERLRYQGGPSSYVDADSDGVVRDVKFRPWEGEGAPDGGEAPTLRNADLAELRYFPEVETFTLYDTFVTDAGLAHLRALPKLRELRLGTSIGEKYKTIPISDEGMDEVAQLKNLRVLELWEMRITDEGMKKLRPLKQLTSLTVDGTLITDEGLRSLDALENLEELFLDNQEVSSAAMAETIGHMRKLRRLGLSGVNGAAPLGSAIGKLSNLTYLQLSGEQVRDEDLHWLQGLDKLAELHVGGTSVTKAGLEKLQASMKNLKKADFY